MKKMKLHIKLLVIFLITGVLANAQVDRSKMPQPGPAPQIQLQVPSEFTLDNGMTVLVVENKKLPRVSYNLTIDNLPFLEGDQAGVLNMLSAMLGNGTATISKDEFNEEVDFLGANISFSSNGGFASGLSKYSERLLELLADAAMNPLMVEDEFKKEKDKQIEGLKLGEKSVETVTNRVENALVYGTHHPYGEFITEETLNNISLVNVLACYEKLFNPANAYLVVIGDIDTKTIKDQVNKYFGNWKSKAVTSASVPKPSPNVQFTQINFVDMPNAVQSNIVLANNVELKMGDKDYHAALIANFILGGGATGYLFKNLRNDKGYTYGSYSSIGASRFGASKFSATAEVRNEVTDSSMIEILKEVKRVGSEKVSSETLKRAKAAYVGNFVIALEQPQTIARFALNIKLNDLPQDFYSTYLEKINAVTAEDVNRVANKYFKTENARIVVVGKGSDVLENLEKTGIPIKYFDPYANPTEKPNYAIEMPNDMDANKVLNAYIDAIGGRGQLDKVNSVFITAESELQPGVLMNLEMKKTIKNQSLQQITVMGQSQKTVLDGTSGYNFAQGQKMDMNEDQIKEAQIQSSPFPEVNYLNGVLTLEKIEDVDGEKAYKIKVDDKTSIYYSANTGLKIKVDTTSEMGSSSVFYSDYQEVAGIKFPFKISQTFGPRKFDFLVKEVKVNEGVSDADFD